jgi:hypothetical protein
VLGCGCAEDELHHVDAAGEEGVGDGHLWAGRKGVGEGGRGDG